MFPIYKIENHALRSIKFNLGKTGKQTHKKLKLKVVTPVQPLTHKS